MKQYRAISYLQGVKATSTFSTFRGTDCRLHLNGIYCNPPVGPTVSGEWRPGAYQAVSLHIDIFLPDSPQLPTPELADRDGCFALCDISRPARIVIGTLASSITPRIASGAFFLSALAALHIPIPIHIHNVPYPYGLALAMGI